MARAYRNIGARPVSISLTATQIEQMDIKRGNYSRSEFIQTLISRASDSQPTLLSEATLKQILISLSNNAEFMDSLKNYIPRAVLLEAIQSLTEIKLAKTPIENSNEVQ